MPTFHHKARVLTDWGLSMIFRREAVHLQAIEHADEDSRAALTADLPRAA
ncbi:hypothetical protein ACQEVF_36260 [Nonomuraea polychroma]